MTFEVFGQSSPIEASQPSHFHYMIHDGPVAPHADWVITDNGTLFTTFMFDLSANYGTLFEVDKRPGDFIHVGPGAGSTRVSVDDIFDDTGNGYGKLTMDDAGLHSSVTFSADTGCWATGWVPLRLRK